MIAFLFQRWDLPPPGLYEGEGTFFITTFPLFGFFFITTKAAGTVSTLWGFLNSPQLARKGPNDGKLSFGPGLVLACRLLRPCLPHDLCDYIAKSVDEVHVLLVVKTGCWKTGLFWGYCLDISIDPGSLSALPSSGNFCYNVVVYPTKRLKKEMVSSRHMFWHYLVRENIP